MSKATHIYPTNYKWKAFCKQYFHLRRQPKMETVTKIRVLSFLAMVMVILRGDEVLGSGGIVQTQTNSTSLSSNKLLKEHATLEGRNQTSNSTEVVLNTKSRYRGRRGSDGGGGGGGSGYGWGWGWGGGGGSGGGNGGGGGGGGWFGWGCRGQRKSNGGGRGRRGIKNSGMHRKRVFNTKDYKLGEFAQCMNRGRCRGMRLDCPLHCGGPCFYDCQFMCKSHCRRP